VLFLLCAAVENPLIAFLAMKHDEVHAYRT